VLENERSELLVRRTESNLDVAGMTRRIQELETELHRIARNYLADTELRLAALNTSLARFAGSVAELPAREVELRRLARQTELLEEVYQMIELKLKEEEIRAAAQLANVQVVDTAVIPDEAEYPKPWLYLVLSGVFGLFAGSGAAVLRSRTNPTVNTREDVFSATAGLPVLAAIDLSRHVGIGGNGTRTLLRRSGNGPGDSVRIGAVWPSGRPFAGASPPRPTPLISLVDPADRLADSYRALRTNMGSVNATDTGQVLVLAGADAGDDSAVTAANLAIAYAQQGTRVALVDADLRTGSLHALFGVAKEPGLADTLGSPDSLSDVVQEISVGGAGTPLHLLCSGTLKHNAADAVGSLAMRTLLARLREQYEQVIVTAPPVNTAPDAALLSQSANRALLVVTAGATRRPSLEAAARQLQHLRVPVEGVVMNGFA
jgi:tyrosine-protein kinase Etk/Wzc